LGAPFPDFCGNIAAQEELGVVVWRKELEMSDFRGGAMIKVPHSGEDLLKQLGNGCDKEGTLR
jgi:hypothetical protein